MAIKFEVEFEPVVTDKAVENILDSGDKKKIAWLFNLLGWGTSRHTRAEVSRFRDHPDNVLEEAKPERTPKKHRGNSRSVVKGRALKNFLGKPDFVRSRHR